MSTEFFRSTRSLRQDSHRATLIRLSVVAGLLAAWCAWLLSAHLTLYAVTEEARVELDRAIHPIDTPLSGRVVTTHLILDREVQAGEVLVTLEAETEKRQLDRERAHMAGLAPQIEALQREIAEQEHALREAQEAAEVALAETRASIREAEAGATFAEKELDRLKALHGRRLLSDTELESARAKAEEKRAAADALRLGAERQEREQRAEASDRRAHLEQLRREVTRFEADLASSRAAIGSIQQAIEEHFIRAPASGRLVEVVDLQPGAFADEGDNLAVVAASGQLKVVADYAPSSAIGRIRPGQEARLRLKGFPWTQFGSLPGTVTHVASELRQGRVRVEMEIHPGADFRVPLQHGLPARAEVKVEQVTPAALVLRAVGRLLATQGPATAQEQLPRGEP